MCQETLVTRLRSDKLHLKSISKLTTIIRNSENKELLKSWDSFIGTKTKLSARLQRREGGHVSLVATQMGVDSDEVLARYENPWNYPSATILAQTWDVNFYIEPTNFEDVASSLRKGQVVFVEGSIKKLEHKSTRGGYVGKGTRRDASPLYSVLYYRPYRFKDNFLGFADSFSMIVLGDFHLPSLFSPFRVKWSILFPTLSGLVVLWLQNDPDNAPAAKISMDEGVNSYYLSSEGERKETMIPQKQLLPEAEKQDKTN